MDWLYGNWMSLAVVVAVVIAMVLFARSRAPRAEDTGGGCCGPIDRKAAD